MVKDLNPFSKSKPPVPEELVDTKAEIDPVKAALGKRFDSKAEYLLVSPERAGRYLSITDPTTGDPETNPADSTGAVSPYTQLGTVDDGRVILQRTGVHPTR